MAIPKILEHERKLKNIQDGNGFLAVQTAENIASGNSAFAEGYSTSASGTGSHAEGYYTTANSKSQHTQGEYNVLDTMSASARGTYAHIVGNGTEDAARSNAHTLDWEGNAWFAGNVYVGSNSGIEEDEGSVKLVKETDTIPVIHGGTGAITAEDARTNLGITTPTVTSATLTVEGWTDNGDGRYAQTINVSNVTISSAIVLVDVALTGSDLEADAAALGAWWSGPSSQNVAQGEGTLTFYCVNIPSVNIPINVGVC